MGEQKCKFKCLECGCSAFTVVDATPPMTVREQVESIISTEGFNDIKGYILLDHADFVEFCSDPAIKVASSRERELKKDNHGVLCWLNQEAWKKWRGALVLDKKYAFHLIDLTKEANG